MNFKVPKTIKFYTALGKNPFLISRMSWKPSDLNDLKVFSVIEILAVGRARTSCTFWRENVWRRHTLIMEVLNFYNFDRPKFYRYLKCMAVERARTRLYILAGKGFAPTLHTSSLWKTLNFYIFDRPKLDHSIILLSQVINCVMLAAIAIRKAWKKNCS